MHPPPCIDVRGLRLRRLSENGNSLFLIVLHCAHRSPEPPSYASLNHQDPGTTMVAQQTTWV